ncbi:MAG TPA: GTP 3',8-cyclase MoaA [Bacteroidales bacterium]|jgi:molybdenum cofactor biosynthesis protein A|nr:GTP 3',8-cyclase MoaA [Bacteroidales bacterium]
MFGKKTNMNNGLVDRFGRVHDYLRLSITNHCNFACTYCKPDDKNCEKSGSLLLAEELIELSKAFVQAGIKKIRLTGGEPLLHKDFERIIEEISRLPVELAVTTNGYFLDKYFNTLKRNGVQKLNISLDSLKRERFKTITQRNAFDRVLANLILAIKLGFEVKLNAVIMKGVNEDEIIDFARITNNYNLTVRFIEFMPFKTNNWNLGKTFSRSNILETLQKTFHLISMDPVAGQTAEYYKIPDAKGKIGLISTLSHPFCDECNRIRVMADGKMKNCLFGNKEYDLITPYRQGKNLFDVIHESLASKNAMHGGNHPMHKNSNAPNQNRDMFSIGG